MTYSKGRDQNQDPSPVGHHIKRTQRDYKKNMIITIGVIENMIFSKAEVQGELTHELSINTLQKCASIGLILNRHKKVSFSGTIFKQPYTMINILYYVLFLVHPIHVSVSEIEYSEKDKALQITSRIFIDDLELAIRTQRKESTLDIMEPKNGMTTQQLVKNYLDEHFKVKLEGKAQKMNFLGMETEDAAIVCYIEIENVKKMKTLEVFNDVITETHDDQSNLVHVKYNGPIKSVRLMRDKPLEVFKFDAN
jgi:hypothetical protein